jgi:hypothetical protein
VSAGKNNIFENNIVFSGGFALSAFAWQGSRQRLEQNER